MAIEIVDLPMNSMVIFHSYVNVYQRVLGTNGEISCTLCGKDGDGDILCTSAKLVQLWPWL